MACALFAGGQAPADDQAEARSIVDKAIAAHGGAEKLKKLSAATWKVKGVFHGPMGAQEFTAENAVQYPDKSRFDLRSGPGFRFLSVMHGDKGWVRFGDQASPMDKATVAEVKENLHANWIKTLAPLSDQAILLVPLGESTVGDRPVLGVKVAHKGHRDVLLYFDKETWLLLKSATRMKDLFQGGTEVEAEEVFSDYKEFNGVKRPTKVKEIKDGQISVEEVITDYKLSEKLDDKLFAIEDANPSGQ